MKKIISFLCLFGVFAVTETQAQQQEPPALNDLIVTAAGDSIPCRILSLDENSVAFTAYTDASGYFDMRLDRKHIAGVYPDYYGSDTPARREIIGREPEYYEEYAPLPRPVRSYADGFRLHVNFGYSALIEGEDMGDYIENREVSSGIHFGVSPTRTFSNQDFAVGLAFDFRSHRIQQWNVNTTFAGPLFAFNFPVGYGIDYGLLDIAWGYVHHNETKGGSYFKADTFGARLSVAYVVYLGEGAGLEFRLGVLAANYKKARTNMSNVSTHFSNPQSISSIQLSVGFTFGR